MYFLYKGAGAPASPPRVARWLKEAGAPQPTEAYRGPDVPAWLKDGLQDVLRSLKWGETQAGSVVTSLPSNVRDALRLARRALSTTWVEAWDEHNMLVQYLVFTCGPLRSATLQATFGVVYAELEEASDPLRMYELLLHETAHHALALKEQFTQFLDNPNAVGTHALRPDPRPLRGVLHAAFVMCRLAEGLGRYLEAHPSGGPLDGCPVRERHAFALKSLCEALTVLDDTAVWTEDGCALRATLGVCLEREGAPA
ncbi:HEXXH motif-containing putative peptide modification protein [Streptomyces atratus]|uniref:aKG-HExxH-type peptide beta-hydroxylase n=1 Tax=Streptomyces atratus TaxID=1893 RepID=UPI0032561061